MTEFDFELIDRITKIRSLDKQYNLKEKAYLSFSGGKDSLVVHYLLDLALPKNKIPRIFMNTGLEYSITIDFIKKMQEKDKRIKTITNKKNIRETLEHFGYPFKSKEYSKVVYDFNRGIKNKKINEYLWNVDKETFAKRRGFLCPKKLLYQFNEIGKYNYSDKCCIEIKEKQLNKAKTLSGKSITITGLRSAEGGRRTNVTCISREGKKINPIAPVSDEWLNEFIREFKVELNPLYLSPFLFERTGCVGCPYAINLEKELTTLKIFSKKDFKKAVKIFGKVYEEYKRINYRLSKDFQLEDNKEELLFEN